MVEKALQKLGENHETMITAMVIEGLKDEQLLERYQISKSRLAAIKLSGVWKQKVAKVRREHTKQLYLQMESQRELAISEIVLLIKTGKNEATRLKAAQDLLDRSGMPKNTIVTHEESPEVRDLIPMVQELSSDLDDAMAQLGITDISELSDGVIDAEIVN